MVELNAGSPGHSLELVDRNNLEMQGVEEVLQFNEEKVTVQTVRGDLEIRGQDLHLQSLDLEAGKLAISGFVSALIYDATPDRRSLWKRFFK